MSNALAPDTFDALAAGKALDDLKQQQWRIARRPDGNVRPGDFEWYEGDIPAIADGEVLLRTHALSLAPVMRDYMRGVSMAGERPLDIGEVIHGRGVAQVIASNHSNWSVGDVVQGQIGWQTYKASGMTPQEKMRRMRPNGLPTRYGLGALGMTGLSAWSGLFTVGQPKAGETIVVSGAAGGVGSLVIQMANLAGCDVVGIAGGAEKCSLIERLGCRASIDYKSGHIADQLADMCPDGIDLYFDNVGGNILNACIDRLNLNARIVLCGSISEYVQDNPPTLPDYTRLRRTDAQMRGFFVYNHLSDWDRAVDEMSGWLRDGKLTPLENITHGFQHMPGALAGLYVGTNTGKQICAIRGEPQGWEA